MPAKYLIVESPAKRNLRRLPLQVHKRIIKALSMIQENPIAGVKLHGEFADYYKFRVGDYRVVYKFDKKLSIVEVVKIEHRQGVYR